jgi:hypothetical protein
LPPPEVLSIPDTIPRGVRQPDGTWLLPPELAEAVEIRLLHYAEMPAACGAVIAEQAELGSRETEAATRVADARCRQQLVDLRVEEARLWEPWEVALIVVGGIVLGAGLGFIGGVVAAN